MTGRKSGSGTEARMPGRAPRPVRGEHAEADGLGPRGWAVEARSPKPATLKRRAQRAHRALAEVGEQPEACLEDWHRASEQTDGALPLLLALTRLTPELSRAAKRRRLGRIVRPHRGPPLARTTHPQPKEPPTLRSVDLARGHLRSSRRKRCSSGGAHCRTLPPGSSPWPTPSP
jgi:hypothetical protein